MSYQFEWVVPQRVVLTQIYGEVPADEVTAILMKSRELTLSGQAPVHFIIDVSALANQAFTMPKLKEWSSILPSRTGGWWVVINPNSVTMFAVTLVTKALNVKLKSARSLNEALDILENVDQTLSTVEFVPV